MQRGCRSEISVLNAQAPTEDRCDDSKDSFYEELEQVFHHFPEYHMKILLGDFNAKLGREDILKLTAGNESLHEDGGTHWRGWLRHCYKLEGCGCHWNLSLT
jgi:hypothetical protein